jgi:cell division protein FtsW
MAEELGFLCAIVCCSVVDCYLARITDCSICTRCLGSLVAVGTTSWLGFQAFLNIGALSGLVPLTNSTRL